MHILIDLQGAQTTGSRHRGIGRYSVALAKEIIRIGQEDGHVVEVLLNAAFADALIEVRGRLSGLLSRNAIHVWEPPHAAGRLPDDEYTKAAALVRDAVIRTLQPDVVLITSLFDGIGDEAIATIGDGFDRPLTAVVLYDLIPYIQADIYLTDPALARLYYGKIHQLRRADLALAISTSAGNEAIVHLGLPSEDVVTISTAADAVFLPKPMHQSAQDSLRSRYGLRKEFVMYTGGIDRRKNVDALIRAYASLPSKVRGDKTLAIVCAAKENEKADLLMLGSAYGLQGDDLRITGYVPEEDLIELYTACTLFVFPSLHEGFGLPALEALACGAAVIGSNNSSIPEVVGAQEALFDPKDDASIASKIEQALTDQNFLAWLKARALPQAALFSWESSAQRALEAISTKLAARRLPPPPRPEGRLRMAMVSPLPPDQSGIADYTAKLAPELARHYDIDFIRRGEASGSAEMRGIGAIMSPEEFEAVAHRYDRIVYQMGNSDFHGHIPELIAKFPGTVVLHDTTLGAFTEWKDVIGGRKGYWASQIRDESGYVASLERFQLYSSRQGEVLQQRHHCTAQVVNYATSIIVHSEHAQSFIAATYGEEVARRTSVIPLPIFNPPRSDRKAIRKQLGFSATDVVVCSFGGVAETKLHHVLLEAWFASSLSRNRDCYLLFVGGVGQKVFGERLARMIAAGEGGERVRIIGYVSEKTYRDYVQVADIAVQLRASDRGESSAAAMDVIAAGIPLIASDGGAFKEISRQHALKLDGAAGKAALVEALEWMLTHPAERIEMGARAANHIKNMATPRMVAEMYQAAVEHRTGSTARREDLLRDMRRVVSPETLTTKAAEIGYSISRSLPVRRSRPRLLVDVSEIDSISALDRSLNRIVVSSLREKVRDYSVEPFLVHAGSFLLARQYSYKLFDQSLIDQLDESFDVLPGDVCISFFLPHAANPGRLTFYERCRVWGVPVLVICTDAMLERAESRGAGLSDLLKQVAFHADFVLLESEIAVPRLSRLLEETYGERSFPLRLRVVSGLMERNLTSHVAFVEDGAVGYSDITWLPSPCFRVPADSPYAMFGIGAVVDGRFATTGEEGFLLWGPHLPFRAGRYLLSWSLSIVKEAGARIEVCCRGGSVVLSSVLLAAKEQDSMAYFDIATDVRDLEVRIWVSQKTNLVFKSYEITSLPAPRNDTSPSDLSNQPRRLMKAFRSLAKSGAS